MNPLNSQWHSTFWSKRIYLWCFLHSKIHVYFHILSVSVDKYPGYSSLPLPRYKGEPAPRCASAFFLIVSSAHNKDLSRGRTPRAACPQYFLCDQVIALGRRKRGMTKPSSRKTRPNSRREEPFYPRTIGEGQKRSCYWTVIYSFLSFAQGSLQFYHPSLQCFSQSVLILCAFLPTPITSHTPT